MDTSRRCRDLQRQMGALFTCSEQGGYQRIRTQAVESITDEVADFLTEREFGFERAEKLTGRSGRGWTIDVHTFGPGFAVPWSRC